MPDELAASVETGNAPPGLVALVASRPRVLSAAAVLISRLPPGFALAMAGGAGEWATGAPAAAGSAAAPFPPTARHLPLPRPREGSHGADPAARAQLEAAASVAVMGQQRRVRAAMRSYTAAPAGAATNAATNLSVRTAVRAACRGLRASMDGLRARTPGGFALYALGYDATLAAAGQLAVTGAWAGAIPATQALQRLVYALVIGDALHVYAPFAGVGAHVWRLGGPLACGEPLPVHGDRKSVV